MHKHIFAHSEKGKLDVYAQAFLHITRKKTLDVYV